MAVFLRTALYAQTPAAPTPEINAINTAWALSLRSSCSACRSASSCSKRASPARASRSTSWSKASPTPASAASLLGVGLCLHVRAGQRLHRHHRLLPARAAEPTAPRAFRCWRSGSSSSPSPTPAPRSHRARWSAAAASSATSSTASASPGFIYPIIGHWAWGPDGWLAVTSLPSATSPARPWCTPSAARFRWLARLRSDRGWAASSGGTAAARRCRTTSFSARSAG